MNDFAKMIQSAVADAAAMNKEGRIDDEAQAYRKISTLFEKWANHTISPGAKKTRQDKASEFQRRAETLGRQVTVSGPQRVAMAGEIDPWIGQLIQASSVTFADVGGLTKTKQHLADAFFFASAKTPSGRQRQKTDSLMVGPPGTGKTLLAAATSNELEATFFEARAPSLVTKFLGEAEQRVASLYEAARSLAPSTIFFDEFDALTANRSGRGDGHGAEIRILTTILAQMDGIESKDQNQHVMTIAATNAPWGMDDAILSRFGEIIYVPLPDAEARLAILNIHINKLNNSFVGDLAELVTATEGYSGREIGQLISAVDRRMLREANPDRESVRKQGYSAVEAYTLKLHPLTMDDFCKELRTRKPITSAETCRRYEQWISESGKG